MKVVSLILLLLIVALALVSQSAALPQDPNNIEVLKFSWAKERIGWERDPFGGPIENFDEMRSRARNEKRLDDAKRGGGGGSDRVRREAKADEANLAKQREKAPARYVFVYKAKMKNNSATPIKAVDWDYIFFEPGTENELGRQQFTSDEQIGPGKTKELTVTVRTAPTHTISVTSLNMNEQDQITGKVVVVRVLYADGRVWQAP